VTLRLLSPEELPLPDRRDGSGMAWAYERCKSSRCRGARVTVGFLVPDDAWEAVTGGAGRVLCLSCFDEMAQARGIRYQAEVMPPVAWWDE